MLQQSTTNSFETNEKVENLRKQKSYKNNQMKIINWKYEMESLKTEWVQ